MEENGVWEAFNRAMHASFGSKDKGLRIEARGAALVKTVVLIRWCLSQLHKANDEASAGLVKLWIVALINAVKRAGVMIYLCHLTRLHSKV